MLSKDTAEKYTPKILFMIVAGTVTCFFALLSWNIYTTHDLATKFNGTSVNQSVVISKLDKLSEESELTQKQLDDLKQSTSVQYVNLSNKVDSVKDDLKTIKTLAQNNNEDIDGLKLADERQKSKSEHNSYKITTMERLLSKLDNLVSNR